MGLIVHAGVFLETALNLEIFVIRQLTPFHTFRTEHHPVLLIDWKFTQSLFVQENQTAWNIK
jgi:hypothetical protein